MYHSDTTRRIFDVMSGYYVGNDDDIKTVDYGSMLASAQDVGVFLRALNDGSLSNAHCIR